MTQFSNRYDLCADNMANCGLMGLAYVAAACTSDKPCAINEDAGLILGIVVAHEIGHVLVLRVINNTFSYFYLP